MKRCPNCMQLTEGKFCPECGYDMSTVETLICPKCGIESDTRFCPNCGSNMMDSSEPTIIKGNTELTDNSKSIFEADNSVSSFINDIESIKQNMGVNKGTDSSGEKTLEILKKKPAVIGAAVAVIVLVLIASIGSNSNSNVSSSNASTDSYSTVEENDQNSVVDNDYSSDSSDYSSGSSSYSYSDDGMDLIQGTWTLAGVVTDGEVTNLTGYSLGSLVINGNKWSMMISSDTTTENAGTLYFDMSGNLDSGGMYYVYTMQSDEYGGYVRMSYSSDDNFIAVSTSTTLDANNCMMFAR